MRTTVLTLLAVLLVAGVGCSDPLKTYIIASNRVIGAANAGKVLVEAGAMNQDEAKAYAKLLDNADAALVLARVAIDANSPVNLSIDGILDQLIDIQVAAMKRRKGN